MGAQLNNARFELPLLKSTGAFRVPARNTDEGRIIVFLDIARTLPRQVRSIPQKGGKKYDWPGKITFHLDLEELEGLRNFIDDRPGEKPFCIFHKPADRNPKKLFISKDEKKRWVVKAEFEGQEIVLTLQRADISLLGLGIKNLVGRMLWTTSN